MTLPLHLSFFEALAASQQQGMSSLSMGNSCHDIASLVLACLPIEEWKHREKKCQPFLFAAVLNLAWAAGSQMVVG